MTGDEPTYEKYLELDLRIASFHEAGHAIGYWSFGIRSRLQIYKREADPEKEKLIGGRCEGIEYHGEPKEFLPRENATMCLAGWLSELIHRSGDDCQLSADDALESIYDGEGPSESDLRGITNFHDGTFEDPELYELLDDTFALLYENWPRVTRVAEFLISQFNEEGEANLSGGMCWDLIEGAAAEDGGSRKMDT
jgi:hypothetical protein